MSAWRLARIGVVIALASGAWGGAPAAAAREAPAPAVAFSVNSANDGAADFTNDATHTICRTNVNNSTCTLRAAIMNANRLAGGATIHLPAGSYFLTIPPSGPDDETTGNLNIATRVTIIGAGAGSTTLDGGLLDSLFWITPSASLAMSGVTLQDGGAPGFGSVGGAVVNSGQLSLSDSALNGNRASGAGALSNSGTAVLDRVTLEGNRATVGQGGAIYNEGILTITNSTLDGNRAALAGGGIFNNLTGVLTLFDSTLNANSSQNSGGGVYNLGLTRLLADTIAGNLADSDGTGSPGESGGGVANAVGADHLLLANTLLADNFISVTQNDCSGPATSQDYDELETTSGCALAGLTTHNVINLINDPLMGPLADNGGATQTRGLLPGNPALDKILPAQCPDLFGTSPAPDQRGVARPVNGKCDIGAFEGVLPQAPYFSNLVRNGDAEASAGSPTAARVYPANWLAQPQFTAVTYGAPNGFPGVLSPTVPSNHGFNFFAGGRVAASTAYQTIRLPVDVTVIDSGGVQYVLSADLGGFGSRDDNAEVAVAFLDAFSNPIGFGGTTLGPVTAADRGNLTGFQHVVSPPVPVPVNAYYATISVVLTRVNVGLYNDGFADNISLILLPPAALWLPLARR